MPSTYTKTGSVRPGRWKRCSAFSSTSGPCTAPSFWSCTRVVLPDTPYGDYSPLERLLRPDRGLLFPYHLCFHPESALHDRMVRRWNRCAAAASECGSGTDYVSIIACFTGLLTRLPRLLSQENEWTRYPLEDGEWFKQPVLGFLRALLATARRRFLGIIA